MAAKEILITAVMLGGAAGYVWSSLPPATVQSPEHSKQIERSVHYAGCNEVRALGKAPLYAGQPGYRPEMDGDGDGVACEPHVGQAWSPDAAGFSRRMARLSLHAHR